MSSLIGYLYVMSYHWLPCWADRTWALFKSSEWLEKVAKKQNFVWFAFNLLFHGTCGRSFKNIIFKHIIQNSNLGTQCKLVLRKMPQSWTNEKPTFVQVMDRYSQAFKPLPEPMLTKTSVTIMASLEHNELS